MRGRANLVSILWPENGRQTGRGTSRVQVTQGPRHPPRPSNRQTGRAGRQGGHVKTPAPSQDRSSFWKEPKWRGVSQNSHLIRLHWAWRRPCDDTGPTFQDELYFFPHQVSLYAPTHREKGKTLAAAHVHIWRKRHFCWRKKSLKSFFCCFLSFSNLW